MMYKISWLIKQKHSQQYRPKSMISFFNRFNPTPFLGLSQAKTWISNNICPLSWSLLCSMIWVEMWLFVFFYFGGIVWLSLFKFSIHNIHVLTIVFFIGYKRYCHQTEIFYCINPEVYSDKTHIKAPIFLTYIQYSILVIIKMYKSNSKSRSWM